jgi:isoprenylcysteine carboxyl methyltransferase (ICMT) family protein YpbQ
VVVVILLTIGFFGWIILMPLDAERFNWSPDFPLWVKIMGGLLLIPSAVLLKRSFMDNPYLSGLVRVQSERKQQVISTGVYSLVRHPMYLGATCLFFGAPLLMGSLVGIVFGVFLTILLAVRSVGEEKMLNVSRETIGLILFPRGPYFRLVPYRSFFAIPNDGSIEHPGIFEQTFFHIFLSCKVLNVLTLVFFGFFVNKRTHTANSGFYTLILASA